MKKILFIVLLIVGTLTHAQRNKDYFLSPQNIHWTDTSIPQDISHSKDFLDWKKSLLADDPPMRWAYISLVKDGSEEAVVQELIGGSGGLNSIIMIKKNGKWKATMKLFGGFLFAPVPNINHELIVYQRMGADYSRVQYRFNGNSYTKIQTMDFPFEFSRPELFPIDFHELFWFMNYGYWRERPKWEKRVGPNK